MSLLANIVTRNKSNILKDQSSFRFFTLSKSDIIIEKVLEGTFNMEMKEVQKGDYKVIGFSGSLDTGTSPEVEKKINEYIEAGNLKFVFNFENTKYMSSSGLRVLLATAKKLKGKGELKISNLNSVIEEVFDVSGFSSILNVYKTEEEALA